jgi:hypothetical protein
MPEGTEKLKVAGVEFTIGDREVETPDGEGTIVDFDHARLRIGVQLDSGEIRYYSWRDVQL